MAKKKKKKAEALSCAVRGENTKHRMDFNKKSEHFFHTKTGLKMIKNWARDGLTIQEMANRAELTYTVMYNIIAKNKNCMTAMMKGKEYIDYQVENALLKSALGYKSKVVEITTEYRGGCCVGKFVKETEIEQPPSVQAATFWLTNRSADKWKKDRDKTDALINVKDNEMKISIVQASAEEMKEIEKIKNAGLEDEEDDGNFVEDADYREVNEKENEEENFEDEEE